MSDTDLKKLFDEEVAKGSDKNTILKAFIKAGVDVMDAVREYAKYARGAGMTLTAEQKAEKVKEVLSTVDWGKEDCFTTACELVSEAIDVALSTAQARVRAYASDNDITLPGARGDSIASKEDVVKLLIANKDAKRADLSKAIQGLGYAKGTAETILSMVPYMVAYAQAVHGTENTQPAS